jgi:hypothetical protein
MSKDESIMPEPPEVSLFTKSEKRKTPSNNGGSEAKPEEKKIDQK